MIKLYYFKLSQPSNKVRMCANALGIDYEAIHIDKYKGESGTPQYLAIHPAGKVPAMDDDGFVLFESDAIMRYLCRKYNSSYYPETLKQQAIVDQWCDFVSIHIYTQGFLPLLSNKVVAPKINRPIDQNAITQGETNLKRFLPLIERQLTENPYLAGDSLTIADFCLLSTIDTTEVISLDLASYPNLAKWQKTLCSKDFYQKVHKFYGAGEKAWGN